jgi:hypothetical protein
MATAAGRIKIEGDASNFQRTIREVNVAMQDTATATGESFVTIANNSLALFERVVGYAKGLKDHVANQMVMAADVERGNVSWRMLQRQNKELFDAAQNSMEYSVGMLKVRDSIFIIQSLLGKGFNLTKENYQDLIQAATSSAIRLNQPVATMIEQFAAMGTKMEANSEEMKMLGVQIDKDKVFLNYANQIGVAVNKLTEAEKKTAFLQELLSQMSGKSTVSFEEIGTMTDITQAYEHYLDRNIDTSEKYAFRISQIGVNIHKFFQDTTKVAQVEGKKKEEILKSLGGVYETWEDYQASQMTIIDRGGKAFATYSSQYIKDAQRVKDSVEDLKNQWKSDKEMKLHESALIDITAEYHQGIIGIDEYAIRIEQMQKLMGLGEEGTESWYEKIKALSDAQLKEREEMYGSMEMQNTMFQKSSGVTSDFSKKGKKGISEVKKEVIDLTAVLEEYMGVFTRVSTNERAEWLQKLDLFATQMETEMELDDLKREMIQSSLELRKGATIQEATTMQELESARQKELDNFLAYAEARKLSEEELQMGLENIKRKGAKKQAQIEKEAVTMQGRIREMGNSLYVSGMNKVYDIILSGQIKSFEQLLPFIMQQAGGILWAEGTKNIGISLGLTANPFTAWAGPGLLAAGLAQLAAGVGLGFAGNAMAPSTSSTSSARVENQQAEKDLSVDQRASVYLFPSESEWLSNLKKSQKKLRS